MDEHMDFPEHQDTLRWTGLLYIHHTMWFKKEEGRKKKHKQTNKQTKTKTKQKTHNFTTDPVQSTIESFWRNI